MYTEQSKPITPRRIRKSPGAPLVDSSLLRYISAQKKSQFVDIGSATYSSDSGSGVFADANFPSPSLSETTINPYVPIIASTTAGFDSPQLSDIDSTPYITTIQPDRENGPIGRTEPTSRLVGTADEWWLGQFNRHNLAQKLVALGADTGAAQIAGEAVQRYCLVRTARRRIRIFLRERDSLWRNPNSSVDLLPSYDWGAVADASIPDPKNPSNNMQVISTSPSSPLPFTLSSRSPSYGLDDVFEVMQEYGLTGGDICALLTNSPNLALMMPRKSFMMKTEQPQGAFGVVRIRADEEVDTLEDTLERSLNELLMQTLGLRRCVARKVLRSCPGLLSVRGAKSAGQVMAMMSKLGVSEQSVARDQASLPVLLSRSPAGIFRLISFLCSSAVRMPMNQIGPLLRRRDSRQLMDAVIPVPSNVRRKDNNCLTDKDDDGNEFVGTAGDAKDGLFDDCDDDPIAEAAYWSKTREERKQTIEQTYRNMTRTVSTLKNEIGTTDLGKVVSAYPSVLLLDADTQILPVARFLMDDLGILDGDLARVLQLYPMLLGLDINDMQRVVSYILSLGVDEELLPSIFRAFPALLTYRIEDMQTVVSYLQSIGVEDIGAFVTRLPSVLGYSVEKELAPKWEFLSNVHMHAKFEIRKFPAYFSYPFERVIKTRYEYLAYRGVSRQLIPVDAILRFGDVDFAIKVARDEDKGDAFRSFTQKRHALQKQRRQGGTGTPYKKKKKQSKRRSEN